MWPHGSAVRLIAARSPTALRESLSRPLRALKRRSPYMSPKPSSPQSKRTELLRVRLSPDKRRTICARAEECGKPMSTFVREVALGSVPRARPGRVDEKAVYHLGRIGNNLNQLARTANALGRLPEGRRLETVLEELLTALRRIA